MATTTHTRIDSPSHTPAQAAPPAPTRLASLDTLRGLVMVLMALDHTRDFFSGALFDPLDLASTTPAYFFTRWITHYCAPVFVLLAGVGASLYARGRSTGRTALFLLTRGLWLVALEFTLVHYGWRGTFDLHERVLAQVIWAIGWSMVVLGGLVALRLPRWAVAAFGLALIFGHNLLGPVDRAHLGALEPLWTILHVPGTLRPAPGFEIFVLYPLVPWVGVLAAGYALGPLFERPAAARRRWLLRLGTGLTLGFVVLRLAQAYGDPRPWLPRPDALLSLLDFLNVEKYPPSLLFLLMTLGPALLLLARLERAERPGPAARLLGVFGRVPLFYYVLHLMVIRAAAFAVGPFRHDLPTVYLAWTLIVAVLWPVCALLGRLKATQRGWWWSYL